MNRRTFLAACAAAIIAALTGWRLSARETVLARTIRQYGDGVVIERNDMLEADMVVHLPGMPIYTHRLVYRVNGVAPKTIRADQYLVGPNDKVTWEIV
jgi:hypothetical protein